MKRKILRFPFISLPAERYQVRMVKQSTPLLFQVPLPGRQTKFTPSERWGDEGEKNTLAPCLMVTILEIVFAAPVTPCQGKACCKERQLCMPRYTGAPT